MSGSDPDDYTSPYPPSNGLTAFLRSIDNPVPNEARDRKVTATINHMQADTVLAQLVSYELDHPSSYQAMIGGIQHAHEKYQHITLKQGCAIFNRLRAAKLQFDPVWFRIRLIEPLDRDTVRKMTDYQIKSILPALTIEQRSDFMLMRFG